MESRLPNACSILFYCFKFCVYAYLSVFWEAAFVCLNKKFTYSLTWCHMWVMSTKACVVERPLCVPNSCLQALYRPINAPSTLCRVGVSEIGCKLSWMVGGWVCCIGTKFDIFQTLNKHHALADWRIENVADLFGNSDAYSRKHMGCLGCRPVQEMYELWCAAARKTLQTVVLRIRFAASEVSTEYIQ
jgi:hypothetical protein